MKKTSKPYFSDIKDQIVLEGVIGGKNQWHTTTIKDLAGNDRLMGIYQGHTIETNKAIYKFDTYNFIKHIKLKEVIK